MVLREDRGGFEVMAIGDLKKPYIGDILLLSSDQNSESGIESGAMPKGKKLNGHSGCTQEMQF